MKLFLAAFFFLLTGCSKPMPLKGTVLILLDTVRADHLSCYGYKRKTSPHLDALAKKSVLFTQAFSNSPWTLPSTGSLLSGEYPERVFRQTFERSLVTLFKKSGFKTAAFTEGGYVTKAKGLDLGFDVFEEEQGPIQLLKPGMKWDPNAKGDIERTFGRAKTWLKKNKNKPFFLFIHTYEPHTPYTHREFAKGLSSPRIGQTLPVELVEKFRSGEIKLTKDDITYAKALYDSDIKHSDKIVGEFLDFLKEEKLDKETLLIVTSDHGEEFGEHYPRNVADHGHSLRDPLLHIPLILHNPADSYKQKKVEAQVRLVDVLPTVADIFNIELPYPIDGTSLRPLMQGEEWDEQPAFLGQTKRGPPRMALRTKRYKYIVNTGFDFGPVRLIPAPPNRQLYDLKNDPGEQKNVVETRQSVVEKLDKQLRKENARAPRRINDAMPSKAQQERLKSLGYMQ